MSGFPNRPDLSSFGPAMINTRAIRDPSRELDASVWNLIRWQVGGLSAFAPKAFARVLMGSPPTLIAHANTWGSTEAPILSNPDTGVKRLTYGNATNELGETVPISFTWGFGSPVAVTELAQVATFAADPSALNKSVRVATLSNEPGAVLIVCFDGAGSPEDDNEVIVFLG